MLPFTWPESPTEWSSPPPAPRPAFRQLAPLPPGYRLVVPPPQERALEHGTDHIPGRKNITEEEFQAMRVPPAEDQHDPQASAQHACKCSSCLWYNLFYPEFLVDWYESVPGQVPPHPMYTSEDKLIKAVVQLFGYPTIPFPYQARMADRPSEAVMRHLSEVHDQNANGN